MCYYTRVDGEPSFRLPALKNREPADPLDRAVPCPERAAVVLESGQPVCADHLSLVEDCRRGSPL